MEKAGQHRRPADGSAPARRPDRAEASLPNSVLTRLLRDGSVTHSPRMTATIQLSPMALSIQRATRDELLAAYQEALAASNWNDVAVRLNGFNDPDIVRLVGKFNQATLLAVKDAALTVMPGWNARVVGPINQRLGGLMGPTKVLHAGAKEIQDYLLHSPFLKTYVSAKFSGGNPLEGHIFVDNAAAFKTAAVAYMVANGMSQAAAEAKETQVSAFRDGDDVHVHESRGEFTTTIHECMHRFSDLSLLTQIGFNANEGTTEYFTRIICRDQKLTRSGFYESQLNSIEALIGTVGKTTVADAYYSGAIPALRTAVDTAKTPGTFARWTARMKAGNFLQADLLVS